MTGAVEKARDPALLQQGRVLICLGMSKPLFRVFVSAAGGTFFRRAFLCPIRAHGDQGI